MSLSARRVCCQECGCTQELRNGICQECGADLLLYGEILRETENTAPSMTGAVGEKFSGTNTGKLLSSRFGTRMAAAALSVLTLGGAAGVILTNQETPPEPGISVTTPTGSNPGTAPAPLIGTDPSTASDPPTASDPGTVSTPPTGTDPGTPPVPTAGTGSGTAVTVAGKADLNYYNQIPEHAVPDMYYWGNGAVSYDDKPNQDTGVYQYLADASVIDQYISMLQKNGFTLIDTYDFSYKGSSFYSWGFTCDAVPDAEEITLQYKDTKCHISLYYADHTREYRMDVSEDLLVCDTGLRIDGSVADLRPKGPSVEMGLIQLPDGRYQTSDGRLTVSVGTAMILRDGVSCTANASYSAYDDRTQEILQIMNYYRNEGIHFQAPKASLMQGDVFTQRDMRHWRWPECTNIDQLIVHDGNLYPALVFPYKGSWQGASHNEDIYEAQTVRVMLYDTNNIGVFYIYSKFLKGEPKEVEILCAVNLSERRGSIDDATYIKAGNTATVKYAHHEYGTKWETYDWVILEGSDKISINAVGSTCDVTANTPGVAAVQVTYGYSTEEPDVLTGIMRTVSHTRKKVYHFIIE